MSYRYRDPRGRTIEVVVGIGKDVFFSAHRGHRVKSKFLPPRDTFLEAQADLDAYALTKRWARVNDDGNIDKTWWMKKVAL